MPLRILAATGLCLALAACGREPAGPAAATAPATATAPAKPATAATPTNTDMPALRVTTVDGAAYDLAGRRGQWVVVNFWATWCGPCLKEMPDLSELDRRRDDLEVIGLAYEDIEPADMRAFLQAHPVVYPIAIVDVNTPPADFETPRGLPTTYLIGPDGRLAKKFLGPVTAADIEGVIAGGTAEAGA